MREGYKKSPIGEIPSGWILKTIGDEVKFEGGAQPPKEYFINEEKEGYIRLIQIRDYKTDNYLTYIPIDMARKFCTEDDIMIGRYGPPIFQILKGIKGAYNVALLKAIPNEKILNKEYTRYFLSTEKLFKLIDRLSQRTSGQTGVDMEALNNYLIPIPPLKEQEKIVEILSTVDSQIDDTEKLIEKSKELKKGLMQKLLTKGIGHSEFKKTEVGEIPVEWEVYRFFNIIEKIIDFRGRTPKKLGLDWGNGDILALSANNVKMGKIDFEIENYFGSDKLYEKWMSGNELCKNDVLMTMEAPLGNVALVPDDNKYILSQRVVALKTKDMIDNRFILYMLMSDIIQNQLNMLSTGTTAKGINQKNLAKVKVIVPPLREQIKIAVILSSIDNEIEEYENKKQKLEELKKGLMQQLLTGKRRLI